MHQLEGLYAMNAPGCCPSQAPRILPVQSMFRSLCHINVGGSLTQCRRDDRNTPQDADLDNGTDDSIHTSAVASRSKDCKLHFACGLGHRGRTSG